MSYQAGYPEEPNALVQNISSNIQRLTLLTSELQRALSLLGTENDGGQLHQTLQQNQQQGNQLAKDTDRLIKAFSALPVGVDQRQRKIQKERLLNDFSAALNNFQRTQRDAADKEREFVARVRASSRVSGGQPEAHYGNVTPFSSDVMVQDQAEAVTEDDLRLIQERESAIRQLESDITDINDIFKDLGMMVHEQGDMIGKLLCTRCFFKQHRSKRGECRDERPECHAAASTCCRLSAELSEEDVHPEYSVDHCRSRYWTHHLGLCPSVSNALPLQK
ncbi:syntaxin-7-like isoform X1 [Entelurus aequoreus]|uniref:syntaxin-7-like isoform X1 n=1 Tax=Entelurus aequoreus TaxID=161455 RepID=UPI002B1D9E9A|nr:syntaxin-7-like isoform X1 [Entelurus aequoreus]XP_061901112.1 syntaxin-7-like isoform X1 [Entelurus aequoreus]